MAVSRSTLSRTAVDVIGAADGDQSAQVHSTNGHDCSHTGVSGRRTAANFPAHLRTHRLARRGGGAARASGQLAQPLCSLRTSIRNAHVCACASPALCSRSLLRFIIARLCQHLQRIFPSSTAWRAAPLLATRSRYRRSLRLSIIAGAPSFTSNAAGLCGVATPGRRCALSRAAILVRNVCVLVQVHGVLRAGAAVPLGGPHSLLRALTVYHLLLHADTGCVAITGRRRPAASLQQAAECAAAAQQLLDFCLCPHSCTRATVLTLRYPKQLSAQHGRQTDSHGLSCR